MRQSRIHIGKHSEGFPAAVSLVYRCISMADSKSFLGVGGTFVPLESLRGFRVILED